MLRVVVNSTPLIVLCNIGRLDLLQKVYGRIVIPQAVFNEVTEKIALVERIAPVIDDLCKNGFYLDDTVRAIALRQAGENQ